MSILVSFCFFSDEMCKEKQFSLGEPSSDWMNYVKCEFDGKRLKLSDQAHPNDDEWWLYGFEFD